MVDESIQAVLFDALGTLVRLLSPAPLLIDAVYRRGITIAPDAADRAMRAEIAYYRAEHHRASDAPGLKSLQIDRARVIEHELQTGLPLETVRDILLESIVFEPFPDVIPTLEALTNPNPQVGQSYLRVYQDVKGLRLAVVSNWDVSLHGVLERTGLRRFFDVVVTSAEVGAAKPDARPFNVALAALGVDAGAALHVGDSPVEDVEGANAAGLRGLLVVRQGPVPDGAIRDLSALITP